MSWRTFLEIVSPAAVCTHAVHLCQSPFDLFVCCLSAFASPVTFPHALGDPCASVCLYGQGAETWGLSEAWSSPWGGGVHAQPLPCQSPACSFLSPPGSSGPSQANPPVFFLQNVSFSTRILGAAWARGWDTHCWAVCVSTPVPFLRWLPTLGPRCLVSLSPETPRFNLFYQCLFSHLRGQGAMAWAQSSVTWMSFLSVPYRSNALIFVYPVFLVRQQLSSIIRSISATGFCPPEALGKASSHLAF